MQVGYPHELSTLLDMGSEDATHEPTSSRTFTVAITPSLPRYPMLFRCSLGCKNKKTELYSSMRISGDGCHIRTRDFHEWVEFRLASFQERQLFSSVRNNQYAISLPREKADCFEDHWPKRLLLMVLKAYRLDGTMLLRFTAQTKDALKKQSQVEDQH